MRAGHVGQVVKVDHVVAAHRRQLGIAVPEQHLSSKSAIPKIRDQINA